jgi:hypothetical protein
MKYLSPRAIPILIILLCIATRLPQLLSPYLILDGDECVLAMMAKYMYLGKDFSLFFWGQKYGFSLIETIAILPFYTVLGFTTVAVKLGMLALWTTGIYFFYKTLLQLNNKNYIQAFLITLLFISAPAWAVWSMKARGGYLTSFVLSSIMLYLLFKDHTKDYLAFFVSGLLLGLIYQSQPFWLIAIMPFVLYKLFTRKRISLVLWMLVPIAISYISLHFYKQLLQDGYNPWIGIPDGEQCMNHIKRLPNYVYGSLHGNYFFEEYQNPNFFQAAFSVVFVLLIGLMILIGAYQAILKRKEHALFITSVISIVLCLAVTLFCFQMQGRYLLPITGFALISFQLLIIRSRISKAISITAILMSLIGITGVATFWNFKFLPGTKKSFLEALNYLEKKNIYHAFSNHAMLTWQVIFYSNERIYCRSQYLPGRYPIFELAINNVFNRGGRTAVIGYSNQQINPSLRNTVIVNEYFICLYPTKEELGKEFYLVD